MEAKPPTLLDLPVDVFVVMRLAGGLSNELRMLKQACKQLREVVHYVQRTSPTSLRFTSDPHHLAAARNARFRDAVRGLQPQSACLHQLTFEDVFFTEGNVLTLAQYLPKLPALTALRFERCQLAHDGVIVLGASLLLMPSLQRLEFINTPVNDLAAANFGLLLRNRPTFTALHIDGFGAAGATYLALCLPTLPSLAELTLGSVGGDAITALSGCFTGLTALRTLAFDGNQLRHYMNPIVPRLAGLANLSSLSLDHTGIIDMAALVDGVSGLSHLRRLSFRQNGTRDGGACRLVHQLSKVSGLSELRLGNNEMGDSVNGLEHVGRALLGLGALQSLELGDQFIRRDGVAQLVPALANKTALTSLDLTRTQLGSDGAALLAGLSRLRLLVIEGNAVEPHVVEQLRQHHTVVRG